MNAILITVSEFAKPNIVQAIIGGIAANINDFFLPIASLNNHPITAANGWTTDAKLAATFRKLVR